MRVRLAVRLDGALRRLRWAGHAAAEEIESRTPRDRVRRGETQAGLREDGR